MGAFPKSADDEQVHLVDHLFPGLDFRRFQVHMTQDIGMDEPERMRDCPFSVPRDSFACARSVIEYKLVFTLAALLYGPSLVWPWWPTERSGRPCPRCRMKNHFNIPFQ